MQRFVTKQNTLRVIYSGEIHNSNIVMRFVAGKAWLQPVGVC